MADEKKPTADELNATALQFARMKDGPEKNKFFHDNPSLATIYRGIHFPKPETTTIA